MQDRFYTVFTAGRFGVCDNPGVYEFFEDDEVVCETNAEKYVEKSIYYLENVEMQQPFIEKVQHKIKHKYNFYVQWRTILDRVIAEGLERKDDLYEYLSRVNQVVGIDRPFYLPE